MLSCGTRQPDALMVFCEAALARGQTEAVLQLFAGMSPEQLAHPICDALLAAAHERAGHSEQAAAHRQAASRGVPTHFATPMELDNFVRRLAQETI